MISKGGGNKQNQTHCILPLSLNTVIGNGRREFLPRRKERKKRRKKKEKKKKEKKSKSERIMGPDVVGVVMVTNQFENRLFLCFSLVPHYYSLLPSTKEVLS